MPKETINYPATPEGVQNGAEVSVHWSSVDLVGEVQIGFSIPRKELEAYMDELKKSSPGDHTVLWYTPPLTRHELQKAIRTLRRARDAAYGSDE